MPQRVIDLSDAELDDHFRAAGKSAALEAAQCGISVSGTVISEDTEGRTFIVSAVKHPSGEIERAVGTPRRSTRKSAKAA
jgi:hypothetical protein